MSSFLQNRELARIAIRALKIRQVALAKEKSYSIKVGEIGFPKPGEEAAPNIVCLISKDQ